MFILLMTSAGGLSVMAVCLSTCRPLPLVPPPPTYSHHNSGTGGGGRGLDGACCVFTLYVP
jgi:hypothetical protein